MNFSASSFYKVVIPAVGASYANYPIMRHPGDSSPAVLGVAHYSRHKASALLGLCLMRC